jgi:hypothetical protein
LNLRNLLDAMLVGAIVFVAIDAIDRVFEAACGVRDRCMGSKR